MRAAQLGDLTTSALGFGCMGLSQGYGPADDDESVRVIHAALDRGVRMLDTAMSYGQGHNERLLGRVLGPQRPAGVQVATKFGIIRGADGVDLDGRPEQVRGFCEASLHRLGVDVIDLFYLHRVDPQVPLADSVGAMAELVDAGLVRHLGICEVTSDQLRAAHATHPIAAVQFEWSLLWREPETDVVPVARELGVGIVPYSPLGRGLLTATLSADAIDTSDFRRTDPRFHGAELDVNLRQIAALRQLADEYGMTAAQLALGWLLGQGNDVVPIPGTRSLARVEENTGAVELDAAQLAAVEQAAPRAAWAGERRSFAVPGTTRTAT